MGANIGATARAMKHFGLNELRIVAPRDGWPNEPAHSNAVGAVIIIYYELFRNSTPREDVHNIQKLATKEEIEHFLVYLFGKLDKAGCFKAPDKKPAMQQNITNIFTRINSLSSPEVQTLQGIIKSLNQ